MSNLIVDQQTNYEFIVTGDGSPSIRMSNAKWRPEAMHHCDGAFSESVYIYHSVLTDALAQGAAPRILSIGLGCGYNEIITAAHFLAAQTSAIPIENLYIESFEGDKNLRENFILWLSGDLAGGSNSVTGIDQSTQQLTSDLTQALAKTYNQVLEIASLHFDLSKDDLYRFLQKIYRDKQFVIRDWLEPQTRFQNRFGVIYFDAFSNQSTPEVWGEDFLVNFLDQVSDTICGFATYAATGALNRALKKTGFTRLAQPGFSGKRESTKAIKIADFHKQ